MKKDTAKTAGKFIVIILGMAIVFFLLLPFLEPDDTSTQAVRQDKKASPQIFTANPLSELVRKVYSIFARKPHAQNTFALASAAAPTSETNWLAAPNQPVLSAAKNVTNDNPAAAYDAYGNARMIDDSGEWVLIRQTAPEASQRGMHDINSSDKAYDKFTHLERAAKYTGGSQPTPIPDSAWARLWKPVQAFFGDKPKTHTVEQPASEDIILAAANGPTTGLGQRRMNDIYGNRQRANQPGLSDSDLALNPNAANPVFTLLNPTQELKDTADALIATAKAILPPNEATEVIENINKTKEQLIKKTLQIMDEHFNQDAEQAQAEELVSKTISLNCGENLLSGFYHQSQGKDDACYPLNPSQEAEVIQAQQNRRQQLQAALEQLIGYPYQATEPLKMVVILNKTSPNEDPTLLLTTNGEPSNPDIDAQTPAAPETPATPEEATRVFYQYLYQQQGCDKQDCYWVGSAVQRGDPSLRQTIDSSGLQFDGDPLNVLQTVAKRFMDEKSQSSDHDADLAQMLQTKAALPQYIPYTNKDMEKLNQRNKPSKDANGSYTKPEDPFIVFTGNAANAKQMKEVLPPTALVFYDNKQDMVLAQENPSTATERGRIIADRLIQRVEQGAQALVEAKAELNQSATQDIVRHMGPQMQKQAQQALK